MSGLHAKYEKRKRMLQTKNMDDSKKIYESINSSFGNIELPSEN